MLYGKESKKRPAVKGRSVFKVQSPLREKTVFVESALAPAFDNGGLTRTKVAVTKERESLYLFIPHATTAPP